MDVVIENCVVCMYVCVCRYYWIGRNESVMALVLKK